MAEYDVIVAGDYCLDLIFTGLPRFPELGREVVGSGFSMIPGSSYNNAVTLKRLGVRVAWAGDFGNDEFSQWVLARATEEGLDTRLSVRHQRPMRRVTVAASYPEERAFIAYYDPEPAVPAALKALTRATARLLYIPGVYTGPAFHAGMALVRAKGIKLVMDGHMAGEETLADAAVQRTLRRAEIFLPNAAEARQLTGETDIEEVLKVLSTYVNTAVVKDGANGAYCCVGGKILHEPGLAIEPLDTTGAGDAFNSGFLTAQLRGMPAQQCLRWGNIVGGLSTLGMGGTGRVVTQADVLERSVEN